MPPVRSEKRLSDDCPLPQDYQSDNETDEEQLSDPRARNEARHRRLRRAYPAIRQLDYMDSLQARQKRAPGKPRLLRGRFVGLAPDPDLASRDLDGKDRDDNTISPEPIRRNSDVVGPLSSPRSDAAPAAQISRPWHGLRPSPLLSLGAIPDSGSLSPPPPENGNPRPFPRPLPRQPNPEPRPNSVRFPAVLPSSFDFDFQSTAPASATVTTSTTDRPESRNYTSPLLPRTAAGPGPQQAYSSGNSRLSGPAVGPGARPPEGLKRRLSAIGPLPQESIRRWPTANAVPFSPDCEPPLQESTARLLYHSVCGGGHLDPEPSASVNAVNMQLTRPGPPQPPRMITDSLLAAIDGGQNKKAKTRRKSPPPPLPLLPPPPAATFTNPFSRPKPQHAMPSVSLNPFSGSGPVPCLKSLSALSKRSAAAVKDTGPSSATDNSKTNNENSVGADSLGRFGSSPATFAHFHQSPHSTSSQVPFFPSLEQTAALTATPTDAPALAPRPSSSFDRVVPALAPSLAVFERATASLPFKGLTTSSIEPILPFEHKSTPSSISSALPLSPFEYAVTVAVSAPPAIGLSSTRPFEQIAATAAMATASSISALPASFDNTILDNLDVAADSSAVSSSPPSLGQTATTVNTDFLTVSEEDAISALGSLYQRSPISNASVARHFPGLASLSAQTPEDEAAAAASALVSFEQALMSSQMTTPGLFTPVHRRTTASSTLLLERLPELATTTVEETTTMATIMGSNDLLAEAHPPADSNLVIDIDADLLDSMMLGVLGSGGQYQHVDGEGTDTSFLDNRLDYSQFYSGGDTYWGGANNHTHQVDDYGEPVYYYYHCDDEDDSGSSNHMTWSQQHGS